MWNVAEARRISAEHLMTLRPRWAHVQAVGCLAEVFSTPGWWTRSSQWLRGCMTWVTRRRFAAAAFTR